MVVVVIVVLALVWVGSSALHRGPMDSGKGGRAAVLVWRLVFRRGRLVKSTERGSHDCMGFIEMGYLA